MSYTCLIYQIVTWTPSKEYIFLVLCINNYIRYFNMDWFHSFLLCNFLVTVVFLSNFSDYLLRVFVLLSQYRLSYYVCSSRRISSNSWSTVLNTGSTLVRLNKWPHRLTVTTFDDYSDYVIRSVMTETFTSLWRCQLPGRSLLKESLKKILIPSIYTNRLRSRIQIRELRCMWSFYL